MTRKFSNLVFVRLVIIFVVAILFLVQIVKNDSVFAGTELTQGAGVFVFPPQSSASGMATVRLPDGSTLNVSGSQTAGIQEAIDYASDYGWDIFIYGKGPYSSHGIYHLSKGLKFPAIQGKTVRIMDATFDFGNLSTEPAITFDTTMMMDFRMTGSIIAPKTNPAILFQPQKPFPLDGLLNNDGGLVDSRFFFDSITGGSTGVLFNTQFRSINDNTFYFGKIGVSPGGVQISRSGERFSHNILDRIDQASAGSPALPDNLDLYKPKGVAVLPPAGSIGNPGTVILPSGSSLDIAGTQTAGLQEAIDYAVNNNLDLVVYGRGLQSKSITIVNGQPKYPNNGFYQINKALVFPPFSNKTIRMYNVTLNYGKANVPAGLLFDSISNSDIEITGQIVASNTGVALHFKPTAGDGIINSRIRIGHFGTFSSGIGVAFTPSIKPIKNNRFLFHEILENDFGIQIQPPGSNSCFCNNFIRTIHNHGFRQISTQVGQNTTNAHLINNNNLVALSDPDTYSPDVGVQIWGHNNTLFAGVRGSATTKRGVSFEPGSTNNVLTYSGLAAVTPIFEGSSGNSKIQNSSWLFDGALSTPLPTPSPSPSLTPSPTLTPVPTPTPTPTPSPSPNPTLTPSPTPVSSPTPSPTSSPSPTPTLTPTFTPTPIPIPTPTPTPTSSPSPTPSPSTKFSVGDRVETVVNLNVRSLPSLSSFILGTQSAGSQGMVRSGSIYQGGYHWWQVNYDVSPAGWSVESGLKKILPPTPSPTPTPSPSISPTFTPTPSLIPTPTPTPTPSPTPSPSPSLTPSPTLTPVPTLTESPYSSPIFSPTPQACIFIRDLYLGAVGEDVRCLQKYLNSQGFIVSFSGFGSPDNETIYFGFKTRQAVATWQSANNVFPAFGYFGPISRGYYFLVK